MQCPFLGGSSLTGSSLTGSTVYTVFLNAFTNFDLDVLFSS